MNKIFYIITQEDTWAHYLEPNELYIKRVIEDRDFDYFIRSVKRPEIEYLAVDSWEGAKILEGVMFKSIKICINNEFQDVSIENLDIIKPYYTDMKEAIDAMNRLKAHVKEKAIKKEWKF